MHKKSHLFVSILAGCFIFAQALTPVMASADNCTYYHGMTDKYYGFGTTESTRIESSLKNSIHVSFTDNTSYTNTAASGDSSYCEVRTYSLKGKSGNHICYYYVNGSLAHISTQPWYFNF